MKICIVEDNELLLQGLCRLFGAEPGFQVGGAFESAEAVLESSSWRDAEVLLVDIALPGLSGVELIRHLRPQLPRLLMLVFTATENRDTVFDALRAGASGYLLKTCSAAHLVQSLRCLALGGTAISPSIARMVFEEFRAHQCRLGQDLLQQKEKDVLIAVASAIPYEEIAREQKIDVSAVSVILRQVYQKLHSLPV